MSKQIVQEHKENKQTPAEIKSYLKARYKKYSLQEIDINPPKTSKKSHLYYANNSKTWKPQS